MNNTNLYVLLLFMSILILPSISMASGHFYGDYCTIVMKKISNSSIICVYEKTAEKLTQREYAMVIDEHSCLHLIGSDSYRYPVRCFETMKEMYDNAIQFCYESNEFCYYMYNENHIVGERGCSHTSSSNDWCKSGASHIHNGTNLHRSSDFYDVSNNGQWYLNHTLNTSERFEKFK